MNLLLDTHIFLWYITADARLLPAWRSALADPSNQVFLSVVSVWEASLKYRLGKLPLPQPPEIYLPQARIQHKIASLPLDESAIQHLADLPDLHRDPFDRMLICQALDRDLVFMTVDKALLIYPVKTFPKT